METQIHSEYLALTVMTFLFLFAWLPSSIAKAKYYGPKWLASNRGRAGERPLAPWGERVERAYLNLKDYYPAFATGILLVGLMNGFNSVTLMSAWVFVVVRIAHFIAYGFGRVSMRALFFLIGLICQILILGRAASLFL